MSKHTQYCIAHSLTYGNKVEIFDPRDLQCLALKSKGYSSCWYPFPSRRCAEWVLAHMSGNPHFTTSHRAARIYYDRLREGAL